MGLIRDVIDRAAMRRVAGRVRAYVRSAGMSYAQRFLSGQGLRDGYEDTSSDAYVAHSTVRTCMDIRGDALAAMPFRAWGSSRGQRDKQFVPEHELYDRLTPKLFRQLQLYWDAGGNAYLRPEYDGAVAKSEGGVKKSGKRRMPDRFEAYGVPQVTPLRRSIAGPLIAWQLTGPSSPEPVLPEQMVHLSYGCDPFSQDRLLGISKLRSLCYELSSEIAARRWNTGIFRRGGMATQVFKYKPQDPSEDAWLDPDKRKAAEDAINERYGAENGGAMMLPGDFDLVKMGVTPREMDFVVMTGANRDRISATFTVDPVLAGNVDNAGLGEARIKSARILLYELSILSNATSIETELAPILREIDPNLVWQFDRGAVPVLRADEERVMRIALIASQLGVPLNDIIDKHDLPYEKTEWGDDWWIGFSQTTAGDALDSIENPEPRVIGSGPGVPGLPGPGGGPEDDNDTEDPEDTREKSAKGKEAQKETRALVPRRVVSARAIVAQHRRVEEQLLVDAAAEAETQRVARRERRHKAFVTTFSSLEDQLRERMVAYLGGIEREVIKNLTAVMTRSPADQVRKILFDERNADAKLRKFLRPYLEQAITIGTEGAAAQLGVDPIGVKDRTTKAFLDAKVIKVVGINDTIREDLRSALTIGLDEGENVTSMQQRVQTVIHGTDNARALRVARTETAQAVNGGRFLQMRKEGVERLEWLSARDAHVRDSHQELDGEVVNLGEPFSNGLYYPGDPAGEPGETINCRCTTLVVTSDE